MAFTASEMNAAFQNAPASTGIRMYTYLNSAGDDFATTSDFFLPFFVITDLPVGATSSGPAVKVGDLLYVATDGATSATNYAGFYQFTTVTVSGGQVTAIAVTPLHAANV